MRACATLLLFTALTLAFAGGTVARADSVARTENTDWLDRIERVMVAQSGRVLAIPTRAASDSASGSSTEATPLHMVFYAPLSALWILAGPPPETEVVRSATMHRGNLRGGFITITWGMGEITTLGGPEDMPTWQSGDYHPLAVLHDRLLAGPISRPLAALPPDSRFRASGVVELPDRMEGPGDTSRAATLWASLGDHIVVTHPDGRVVTLHWRDVDAALTPVPPEQKTTTGDGEKQ